MFPSRTRTVATVIVPTYNRSKLLAYTLHSIHRQKINQSYLEVIVVDDGSSDDTLAVVEQYKKHLNLKYFFQEDKGYRVASARNIGIANAGSDILIFVDSGVLLGEGCLWAHINAHLGSHEPLAVIGYVYGFDQDNARGEELADRIDCNAPEASIACFRASEEHLDIREVCYRRYNDELSNLPAPWVFFWTCNVSVSRESLEKTGPFDENFDLCWGVEDQELGLRLHRNQVKICLNREAAAIHYPHLKNAEEKFRQIGRNREYFHRKHNLLETDLYLRTEEFELNDVLIALGDDRLPADGKPVDAGVGPVANVFNC